MPKRAGNDSNNHPGSARLGGVRADFVANLGKRIAELRQTWKALADSPGSPTLRNEFQRHLHALTTRSGVLHFDAMADRLERAERRLSRAAAAGGIDAEDVEFFDELFRDLPALAWNEPPVRPPSGTPTPPEPPPGPAFPLAVLVIGRPSLAKSLQSDGIEPRDLVLEVEQTDSLDNALELTRAMAPDVVLIDGDLTGSTIISETLARDPITESTPVVVVGTWSRPEQASTFLAHGVVRTLPKPVSPAKLRTSLRDAFDSRKPEDMDADVGAVTVEDLAERLAQQVRDGLIQAVRPESRRVAVELGQGTEVLAAVWGAVARVREMLTIRSEGAIRFNHVGPAGAVPIAPWLDVHASEEARREGGRETDDDATLLLEGRRVLVVDDDPAVAWFLSGLFRGHGAVVKEAQDGQRGLDLAFQFDPELVVTDILMPKLDGFGLCRALKRDVILRDVPVIVLSWKEDLLQRVRELGVGADGYLRKEATSSAILRTVHESLRPRSRIEDRLRQSGEVRGRLDGLTARTLLSLVGKCMPDASVSVRDAAHLFEVEVRDGRVREASRTSFDGTSVAGEEALISLVRVFTGRFHVAPAHTPIPESTTRPLQDILGPAVAEARAALVLLEGANLSRAHRVTLRLDRLDLESLPESTRSVYRAIADGTPPERLVQEGTIGVGALEQLLADAASRGAVAAIEDVHGKDLLADESEARLRTWLSPLDAQPSHRAPASKSVEPDELPEMQPESSPEPVESTIDLSDIASEETNQSPESFNDDAGAPTSLAEAVIREVAPGSEVTPASGSPSMLDVSELKPRNTSRPEPPSLPSLPPDAIVPAVDSLRPEAVGEANEPSIPDVPSMPPPPPDVASATQDRETNRSDEHEDEDDDADDDDSEDRDDDDSEDRDDDDSEDQDDDDSEDRDDDDSEDQDDESADAARKGLEDAEGSADDIPKRSSAWPILGAVAVGAGLIGAAIYFGGTPDTPSSAGSVVSSASATPPARATRSAGSVGPDPATANTLDAGETYAGQVEEGLPIEGPGEAPLEQGLLEVKTGRKDAVVTVDGRDLGEGDVIRMFLNPGKHRVLVVWQGKQLRGEVDVAVARMTRLTLEDAWGP